MDQDRFDDLARLLGVRGTRRAGVRAALGSMVAGLGLLAGGPFADEAAARRRRRRCDPACPTGQTCDKATRTCRCDNGGAVCGAACCTGGQTCQGGTCVAPTPQCLAFGATCKNVGVPCCDGLVCGSGQGGGDDVACYVPAGSACETTADCVFDATCREGVCVANPQPTPAPACLQAGGDAGANGKALQEAVENAASGDTIKLAAGDYRFDTVMSSSSFGLVCRNKNLTIEPCSAGDVVNLVCPSNAEYISGCCATGGTSGSLTLRRLAVKDSKTFGAVYAGGPTSIELDHVTVEGTYTAVLAYAGGTVTIGPGVTAKTTATATFAALEADRASNAASATSITCTATPTLTVGGSQAKCKETLGGTITIGPCDCGA